MLFSFNRRKQIEPVGEERERESVCVCVKKGEWNVFSLPSSVAWRSQESKRVKTIRSATASAPCEYIKCRRAGWQKSYRERESGSYFFFLHFGGSFSCWLKKKKQRQLFSSPKQNKRQRPWTELNRAESPRVMHSVPHMSPFCFSLFLFLYIKTPDSTVPSTGRCKLFKRNKISF